MSPQDKDATQRVVTAGMKLMYDEKTFPTLVDGIKKEMPMPDKLATEVVGILKLLQDKAKGSIPVQVLLPAGAMLMLEIAKFMHDSKMGDPTPADIKAAYPKLVALLKQEFPEAAPAQAAPPAQPGLLGAA